ncbi:hypothetical protein [Sporolactobacillus putidus]|uniref:Uncharacterized protein n=1 Tax=Sporolactobacillus putidus TaxID=492735 RepID=A0A917S3L6_9BACL|nr:hypothetical protein [Sporolactobacillus putidus]GGL55654.1 hypothetical protein GCM10007968_19740 [Sporolactobacillus putidus]
MSEEVHKNHKLLWIIMTIIAVFIGAGGGGGYYFYHQHQVAVAKAKLIDQENKYDENFRTALSDIYSSYQYAKPITDKYISAWGYYLINGSYWSKTDNMPELVLDVNGLFGYVKDDNKSVLQSLDDFNNNVHQDMSNLSAPPELFKSITDRLNNLYGDYQTLYSLASAPDSSGSLSSYKNQCDEITSKIETEYNEINASIPKVPRK